MNELRNEKIDIIKWSKDPREFIANALSPAKVLDVIIMNEGNACKVVVDDNQLSLAIGKEGQNVRLAAKLTGWKIDIKSKKQYEQELLEKAELEETVALTDEALVDTTAEEAETASELMEDTDIQEEDSEA